MKLSRPLLPLLALAVIIFSTVLAAAQKSDEQMSTANFMVLKDESGKPVRNAAVVLHPVGKNKKQGKAGFELKTDADGKTHFDGVPYGLLRVQVIAHGFQTFGDDYQINQPNQEITIRLKRPQGQYSIYDNSNDNVNQGAATGGAATTSTTPQK
jgi:hypothetical protein